LPQALELEQLKKSHDIKYVMALKPRIDGVARHQMGEGDS